MVNPARHSSAEGSPKRQLRLFGWNRLLRRSAKAALSWSARGPQRFLLEWSTDRVAPGSRHHRLQNSRRCPDLHKQPSSTRPHHCRAGHRPCQDRAGAQGIRATHSTTLAIWNDIVTLAKASLFGTVECFLAISVTSAASSGRVPKAKPPAHWGRKYSLRSVQSAADSFSHITPYSSGVFPEILAMIFTSYCRERAFLQR